jgi:DNA-binding transcriptional LysR family regulator
MTTPFQTLPPLGALRPFEAAARLGSLSAAARELRVSQPAISRQIDGLEAWLGVALFERTPRGLRPTSSGLAFRDTVASAFEAIRQMVDQIRPPDSDRSITIAAHSGFAQLWLAPRLGGLQSIIPNAFLRLVPTDRDADFIQQDVDLAVRFGTADMMGRQAVELLPERIVPVAAPSYLAGRLADGHAPPTPSTLAAERLLHMDEVSNRWLTWNGWFAAEGLAPPTERPRLLYASYPLLLEAARRGEGVALGWLGLVDDALVSGALVPLAAPLDRPSHGYFLCWRGDRLVSAVKRRLIDRVRSWFLAERDGISVVQ